ncbi:MAG: HEAT repeat domain-containing protein [Deltaproteobacteria bacterium]|nr:HEAT repeat domain-containing protein [Deltaproteobacteria bacterium]
MERRRELLTAALGGQNDEIKRLAAEAVEKLETRARMEALAKKIESAEMLERVRAIYAMTDLRGARPVEILVKAAKDPSEDVRAAAVRVLGRIIDISQIQHLVDALKDASPVVQRVAIEVLGTFRDCRLLGHMMQLLKNPDQGVIERALEVIARTGDKRAEEAMLHFAVKGTLKMRAIAIKALGEMDR